MQGFIVQLDRGDAPATRLGSAFDDAAARALAGSARPPVAPESLPPGVDARLILDAGGMLDERVSTAARDGLFVIAYGELDDRTDGGVAERIATGYAAGGVEALGAVFGCYGAAIVDLARRETVLLGDGLGQRMLRHVVADGRVLIATHDILLAAAGVDPQPAADVVASIVRIGWSIGGESLLQGVGTVGAEQVVTIAADGTVTRRLHPAHAAARARRRAGPDVAATREAIIARLVDYVRVHHRPGTPLEVELSAGFDSRIVIGIAKHIAREGTVAFTDGPLDSHDVVVARRVAARMGVPHRPGGVRESSAAGRRARVRELALATGGQATAMGAMTDSDEPLAARADSLGGDGAEVYRGYFYPRTGGGDRLPYDPATMAAFIRDKFRAGAGLLSPEQERRFVERAAARFARWSEIAERMADGYDLFHALERSGAWNQKLRRLVPADRRRNPFYSREALYLFLSMPGSRGRVSRVQQEAMRRYAGPALGIALNGETLPRLWTGGPLARRASDPVTYAAKAMWRVRERIGRVGRAGTALGDLEQMRIDRLLVHLDEDWRPLFGDRSVARAVIGGAAIDRLLAAARERQRWACETVANLAVLETFFVAAREAAAVR